MNERSRFMKPKIQFFSITRIGLRLFGSSPFSVPLAPLLRMGFSCIHIFLNAACCVSSVRNTLCWIIFILCNTDATYKYERYVFYGVRSIQHHGINKVVPCGVSRVMQTWSRDLCQLLKGGFNLPFPDLPVPCLYIHRCSYSLRTEFSEWILSNMMC